MYGSVRLIHALLLIETLAFWSVWKWYITRIWDKSDEPWGLVALGTCVLFCVRSRSRREVGKPTLFLITGAMLIYALTYGYAPPVVRALIAVTAVALTVSPIAFGSRIHFGSWGLLMLSLPAIHSLQFYAGYPLRLLSGHIAVILLQTGGVDVSLEGLALRWGGQLVWIDAPCSGIRMLWAAMYGVFTVSCIFNLNHFRTVCLGATGLAAVILGNGLRTAVLFFSEAGIVTAPRWSHEAVGMSAFAVALGFIVWFAGRLSEQAGYADAGLGSTFKPLPPTASQGAGHDAPTPTHRAAMGLLAAAGVAAALVSLTWHGNAPASSLTGFPGWPDTFENRPVKQEALSLTEARLADDFPGATGKFSSGSNVIIFRWITRATRKLHPAADCFRALGYALTPMPMYVDPAGGVWGRMEARRGTERLTVREHIRDLSGKQGWADVSSWYWGALLGKSSGPWWAATVVENVGHP
ncbi:MAG: archaeosortase/exosortase family protein [Pseudomonadota bacterium]